MKKYLLLSVFVMIIFYNNSKATDIDNFCLSSNSSNRKPYPYQDTVQYLKDKIITHKSNFQHKKLNFILNELNITVKSYTLIFSSKIGGPLRCICLYFEDSNTTFNKYQSRLTVPFLNIYFENDVAATKALGLATKSMSKWGTDEVDFYGKLIVKDIEGLNVIKKH